MVDIATIIERGMKAVGKYFTCPLTRCLPATRFYALKASIYRMAGICVGNNTRLVSSIRILTSGKVEIGDDTFVGHECLIVGGDAPITIGSSCDIGPRVTIASGTHRIQPNGPHVAGEGYSLPISIGDGCWICTGATILGGTIIGSRSVVAAGAVVKGEYPAGSLIGGIPSRVLRTL